MNKDYTFKADVVFQARNIDDAFKKLEKHFRDMRLGKRDEPWFTGEMHIDSKEI